MVKTSNPQPVTPEEARRRLAAAYRLLLDVAARRRAAEQQTADNRNTADARTDHRDR